MGIWGKEAATPLLCLHMGYSLGNVIGPALSAPFLSHIINNSTGNLTNEDYLVYSQLENIPWQYFISFNTSDRTNLFHSDTIEFISGNATNITDTNIQIPYSVSGGLTIIVGIAFFLFFVFGLPHEDIICKTSKSSENEPVDLSQPVEDSVSSVNHSTIQQISDERLDDYGNALQQTKLKISRIIKLKSVLSPGACAGGNVSYGAKFFSLLFFFYFFYVAANSFKTFLLPLAISKSLGLSKTTGSYIVMTAAICSTIGRSLSAVTAKFLPIQIMLFAQIAGVVVSQGSITFWGLHSAIVFWVGNCFLSLFNAPLFPTAMAWSDRYVQMTAIAVGLIDIGTGIGSFIFNWLTGYLIQYKSNESAMYVGMGAVFTFTVLAVLLQALASWRGQRFEKVMSEQNITEEVVDA